ncbi:MAG: hypothetical protein R3F30_08055 [Planctomycetota bacterium]
MLLFLSLPSCGREEPADVGAGDGKQAQAQQAGGATSSPLPAVGTYAGADVLARWAERFARVPATAYDAPLPALDDARRAELVDKWATATTSSRRMARYAAEARDQLMQDRPAALAALAAFLELPSNPPDDELRALTMIADYDAPAVVGFCLRHLTDENRLVRLWCVRRLGELDAPHAVPRLLVRIREFYEEDPEVLAAVFETLAIHGNLAGLSRLLAWVGDPAWVERAGPSLIRIVGTCGTPYDESEGWDGLLAKARLHERNWRETGVADRPATAPAGGAPAPENGGGHEAAGDGAPDDRAERDYLAQREWWLLLRDFDEFQLRPVDEARFAAREGGVAAVALLREALGDQRVNVRMPALEALLELRRPGKPCAPEVATLFGDRLCRATALNVYGAIGADDALEVLTRVVDAAPATPATAAPAAPGAPGREVLIAALHGLAELGAARLDLVDMLARRLAATDEDELHAWYLAALLASSRSLRAGYEADLDKMLADKRYHEPTLLEIRRKYR